MIDSKELYRLTGIDIKTLHDVINPRRIESNREELKKIIDEHDVVLFKPNSWIRKVKSDLVVVTGNYKPYLDELLNLSEVVVYPREPKRAALAYRPAVIFSCQEGEFETIYNTRVIRLDPLVDDYKTDSITTPDPILTVKLGIMLLDRPRFTHIKVTKLIKG